ncbi:MAG: HlyD family efflux transporter periplasmic adaptor subunit [Planctomycetota bacterium]|nr:HlyD family efflux transporter periplasmic adaptor subunit [Planctomycetota bacterium]
MIIKFGIPILAAVALGFGAATTVILKPEDQLTTAPNPPATTTLGEDTVAGLGEFQSPGEPIAVGTALPGIVKSVHVVAGDSVHRGQPLFAIDDRELQAELDLKQQMLAAAEARLERLRAGTRPEDLPPARARVEAVRIAVERTQDLLARGESLGTQGAMSGEELRGRWFANKLAHAELLEAQATLARLEAGTWTPDIVVAERERDQALADVRMTQMQIERLVVRSPADATVLRIDVREGEFVQAGESIRPSAVIAKSGGLEVRVQVDEEDASRVRPGAPAEGFVRGRDRIRIEMEFLRVEPRVVPKTSITGSTTERVDTRVLFVVYRVVGSPERVYAGQKLDVFINADAK